MAQLKDTTVNGNLNLKGNIFGNVEGSFEDIPIRSSSKIPTISFNDYGRIGIDNVNGCLMRYDSGGTGHCIFDDGGVIPVKNGGTGINYLGANNQVLMSNGSKACWGNVNSLKPDNTKYADNTNYADCTGRVSAAFLKQLL